MLKKKTEENVNKSLKSSQIFVRFKKHETHTEIDVIKIGNLHAIEIEIRFHLFFFFLRIPAHFF